MTFGEHFKGALTSRIDELRNPDWAIRPVGYIRYLLETSLCDFYVTLERNYDKRCIGEDPALPVSLKDPAEGAVKLLRYYLGRPIGSIDHMLHW